MFIVVKQWLFYYIFNQQISKWIEGLLLGDEHTSGTVKKVYSTNGRGTYRPHWEVTGIALLDGYDAFSKVPFKHLCYAHRLGYYAVSVCLDVPASFYLCFYSRRNTTEMGQWSTENR